MKRMALVAGVSMVREKKMNLMNSILSQEDMCHALLILFVIPSLVLEQEKEHTVVWSLIFNCCLDSTKNHLGRDS